MGRRYKHILSFLLGASLASSVFLCTRNHALQRELVNTEAPTVKTETKVITRVDTLYKVVYKPKYIKETVIKVDTVKVNTVLKTTQRVYTQSVAGDTVSGSIKAVISGINPQLDTLEYRLRVPTRTIVKTITTTQTKYKAKRWRATLGVGAGYGLINKQADVFVGVTAGYSF